VFATSPTLTTPISATLTAPASTNLTLTSGLIGTNKVNFPDTLTASSSTAGAVTIGNGSAATNVAIGGGKVNIGDTTAGSSNTGALLVTGGLSAGNNGNASYFGGALSVTGNLQVGTASGNEYILKPGDSTATGSLQIQAGGGSALYGGSTVYYSGSHSNRPGWVWVGLGSGSTRKFVIADSGLGTGNEVFSVNQTGAATFAGTVIAPAATASLAPLRIPHGTAPTSPTNGDMWSTTAGLFIRINGVTKTVTLT